MFVIQEFSYFKPYEEDTGLTITTSMPDLTATISNPIQEMGIDIPVILSEPTDFPEELISIAEKNDYRPLLDSDPTDEF